MQYFNKHGSFAELEANMSLHLLCNRAYARGDRRRNRSEQSSWRLSQRSSPVAPCIHYRRSSPRRSLRQSQRQSARVYAL